jgi:NAD(P)-dependent dehydrogenase (short-subunit alcohol dehydrogenase family)
MDYRNYDRNFSLQGKVALITGGAKGIGKAIASVYAEKGASLVLLDISPELDGTVKAIAAKGGRVLGLTTDLRIKNELVKAVERAVKEFGRIDILVNNAGVVLLDEAENLSEEYWDMTMDVNLKAPFILSQIVARTMMKQKQGRIINIASQAGVISLDRHVAYTASKAAIIGMTKVCACEWAEYGIRVNAISPTVILTELGEKAWAGEVGEAMKKKIPARRFGYPEEVAACAVFLAADATDLMTGANLVIDGGYTVQ